MRLVVVAALLLTAPAVFAQAEQPVQRSLGECIGSLGSEVIGVEAIEAACPGAEQALRELNVAQFIPEWQWSTLGAEGIENLQAIERRYREAPQGNTPDVDGLRSVLDSLRKPTQMQATEGWFERLKRWLRDTFNQQRDDSPSWLERWLNENSMSETAREVLFYSVVAVILVLAIVVVVNEVRVARKGRRMRHDQQTNKAPSAEATVINPDLLDVDTAARTDRPSIVLRMLVATLVKTGRLPAARSFTHTELTTRARFDDSSQRQSFQRVSQLAERIVYGGDAGGTDLDEVVAAGQVLNTQLASGAAGAAS